MSRRARLWLGWAFLVFGLFNLYGPDISAYRRADDPPDITAAQINERLSKPRLILAILRDDADTQRYFAYANAILGRPAPNYFIRSAEAWAEEESKAPSKRKGMTEAGKPLWPWRDFSVEYPPGMLALILPPALLSGDFSTFHFLFGLEMEALLTLAAFFAVKTADLMEPGGGDKALALLLASVAALGIVSVRRFDACVSLATSAAVFGLLARRPALSGFAWAAGIVCKGVPVVLAPLALVWHFFRGDRRELATSLGAAALCLGLSSAIYCAVAGANVADAFLYHARRPLQFETLYGGILIFLRQFDPALATSGYSFGADTIVSAYEPALRRVASLAPFLAMLGVYAWAFRRMKKAAAETDRFAILLSAACACFVAFASLGKVFSPQYMAWLIPLGALASLRAGERARLWMIVAFALTQIEYPFVYSSLSDSPDPVYGLLLLARTGALWTWIGFLLKAPDRAVQGNAQDAFPFAQKIPTSAEAV